MNITFWQTSRGQRGKGKMVDLEVLPGQKSHMCQGSVVVKSLGKQGGWNGGQCGLQDSSPAEQQATAHSPTNRLSHKAGPKTIGKCFKQEDDKIKCSFGNTGQKS